MLIDFDHGVVEVERPIRLQGIYKRDVDVGHNCWIGYGACILRGVTVGDNCIVGTNTVVTKDVPPNAVVAGAPARRLRMRDAPRRLRWRLTRDGGGGVSRRRPASRLPLPGSFSGAVGPGRGAACREERGGAAVLLGLGRLGGVARPAHGAPGGARELVLAAVAAVGGDRGRVAAGLALRRSAPAPPTALDDACCAFGALEAERGERLRPDDAVDGEAVGGAGSA